MDNAKERLMKQPEDVPASCASPCSPEFRLIRYNPRRALRGAPAAEVEVNGEPLWMSRSDVRNNIRDFGWHPQLAKALEAYDCNKPYSLY